ncbi:MAG: hypothetical protein WA418_14120 [Bradyrhizobium sp.]
MPKNRVLVSEGRSVSTCNISITSETLWRLAGPSTEPMLIDVRTDSDFAAHPRLIPAARRRSHLTIHGWLAALQGAPSSSFARRPGAQQGRAEWVRTAASPLRTWKVAGAETPERRRITPTNKLKP